MTSTCDDQHVALRLMTYNVHSCIGVDLQLWPARVADVIRAHQPDIVALQEVDVGRTRTGAVDQAAMIAAHLDMSHEFFPAIDGGDGQYGDAILSKHPMELVKAARLPGLDHNSDIEPRGALLVRVNVGDLALNVVNTHLGLSAKERMRQADALLGPDWLGGPHRHGPHILCGDFNAVPNSAVFRRLTRALRDAQAAAQGRRPYRTWPSRFPIFRLDHILVSNEIAVGSVTVARDRVSRKASDHLPVIAYISVPVAAESIADIERGHNAHAMAS